MAKMFITGSARSPSNEEFKARIARLAEMPAHHAAPSAARRNKPAKPAYQPQPEEPDEQAPSAEPSSEEPAEETD
ncbi:hypothetical protein [Methylobacterium sp. SyP6R]|uniref:hypothetical protein n=1 Tax=Methylobacterium sp. SyP6R TaxID=2718876 RepID=UPI001F193047|nr:hypothetical protein [Methylobacterium sp. SyP6R]MCF4128066.1 hypothetical protein [Methylobacterium sp. SyP6R]